MRCNSTIKPKNFLELRSKVLEALLLHDLGEVFHGVFYALVEDETSPNGETEENECGEHAQYHSRDAVVTGAFHFFFLQSDEFLQEGFGGGHVVRLDFARYSTPMWIDTHCHPFVNASLAEQEAILARAREAGVGQMIVVGFDKVANREAVRMAEAHEGLWAAVGVHPCECAAWTDEEEVFIREAAKNPKVVALGEMGMDFYHKDFPKDVQEATFRRQIRLANELDLPCIVHSREAAEDTLRILLDEGAKRAVFHCYSYDYEFGKKVWAAGYYTSFSGVLTYPNAKPIQEAAAKGPLDLMLIETDCPWLAPQSIRGKPNEMAFVGEVGKKLAELRGVDSEEIQEICLRNANRLFVKNT